MVAVVTFTGVPEAFWTWTVIGPRWRCWTPYPMTGEVVKTSLVPVEPLTTVTDIPEPQVEAAVLLFPSPP